MFEESLSHCPINVTHFPFDNQRCYLVFESWKYNNSQLIINSSLMEETQYHYHESEQWELFGRYTLSILFSAVTRIFTALHGMQTRSSDENSVREKSEFIFIRENNVYGRRSFFVGMKLSRSLSTIWHRHCDPVVTSFNGLCAQCTLPLLGEFAIHYCIAEHTPEGSNTDRQLIRSANDMLL